MRLCFQTRGPRPDIHPMALRCFNLSLVCLIAVAASFAAPLANAQGLERVEEIWGDAGPLNESMRVLPLDLRSPVGFQGVYRVPGHDNLLTRMDGGLAAVFPRSVYAATASGVVPLIPPGTVFHVGGVSDIKPSPTSNLLESKGSLLGVSRRQEQRVDTRVSMPRPQTYAIAPRLAGSFENYPDQHADHQADQQVVRQVVQRVGHNTSNASPDSQAQAVSPERSIWEDEWYRRQRVGELLSRFTR